MPCPFSRAPQFLAGLSDKSETELHDAFIAEVLETGGTLITPDGGRTAFFEIDLHQVWAAGATELELFLNWQSLAQIEFGTQRNQACAAQNNGWQL